MRLTEETMPLPKAIEEANAQAEELLRRMQEDPNAAPASQQQQPAPVTGEPPSRPALMEAPDDDADVKHKYSVLQGKYRAEVVEVARLNRELKARVAELEQENGQLKTAAPAQPQVTAEQLAELITPEEREQYGDDFINFLTKFVGRMAKPATAPAVDMQLVEQRLKPVEERNEQTAKRLFFADLTRVYPEWKALNRDEGFLRWLAEVDPFTGHQRQTLFDDAYKQFDVERITTFFQAYSGQSSVGAAPSLPSFEEQVVPNTGSPTPPAPPGKRRWTSGEIAKFYDDCRQGLIKPQDAALIEQDIFAAQREGRIRTGRPR